ncbi:MAG: DoxX family protein [Muribaculaceae bacterium]|nr:DoxX family protein [Muribaculaceae bacterium]
MTEAVKKKVIKAFVIIFRLIIGATFAVSGWAKAVDPFGFVLKVGEYLDVWELPVPHEAIVAGCVALACVEFCTGVMLAAGCLKRLSVWVAAALILFMLPLTVYIAIENPVADCGCFGDLWHISNTATLLKNVVLGMMIAFLLVHNREVNGLYPAEIQWITITLTYAFPLYLALTGYQVQPLVDFRPYKIGTEIFASQSSDSETEYIYEKNGQREHFSLENLPDSTWTYVGESSPKESNSFDSGISVYDADGNDVTSDIVSADMPQLFLIIPEPGMHYLSYAHNVSRLYEYCLKHGIEMTGVIDGTDDKPERWMDWCRPEFKVYTADPIALKQLVRGPEALVYTEGGIIRWKRTLSSMPYSILSDKPGNVLAQLRSPDDGYLHTWALAIYACSMIVCYMLGLSPKVIRLFLRRCFIISDKPQAKKSEIDL